MKTSSGQLWEVELRLRSDETHTFDGPRKTLIYIDRMSMAENPISNGKLVSMIKTRGMGTLHDFS